MPRVRYTADGGHYRVGGHGFDPGDEQDVDDDLAAYLADQDEFEVIKQADDAPREEDEPPDKSADTGDDVDEAGDDEFDVDAFVDRTPYEDVVEDIHAGKADDHLDAVAEAADRVTVQDAIGERRAELEG